MTSKALAVVSVAVNNVLWAPYVPANDCSTVTVYNPSTGTIKMRSTDSDPTTEISLPVGAQFQIGGPARSAYPFRFQYGVAALAFQAVDALNTGPIQVIEQL